MFKFLGRFWTYTVAMALICLLLLVLYEKACAPDEPDIYKDDGDSTVHVDPRPPIIKDGTVYTKPDSSLVVVPKKPDVVETITVADSLGNELGVIDIIQKQPGWLPELLGHDPIRVKSITSDGTVIYSTNQPVPIINPRLAIRGGVVGTSRGFAVMLQPYEISIRGINIGATPLYYPVTKLAGVAPIVGLEVRDRLSLHGGYDLIHSNYLFGISYRF